MANVESDDIAAKRVRTMNTNDCISCFTKLELKKYGKTLPMCFANHP